MIRELLYTLRSSEENQYESVPDAVDAAQDKSLYSDAIHVIKDCDEIVAVVIFGKIFWE
jgi:hypothetical protein